MVFPMYTPYISGPWYTLNLIFKNQIYLCSYAFFFFVQQTQTHCPPCVQVLWNVGEQNTPRPDGQSLANNSTNIWLPSSWQVSGDEEDSYENTYYW